MAALRIDDNISKDGGVQQLCPNDMCHILCIYISKGTEQHRFDSGSAREKESKTKNIID